LKIEKISEYDINVKLEAKIQALLTNSFREIYPSNRIYFKQLPHLRFLAFNQENQLVGHVGLDYRVMNLNGEPLKILGIIDLCVSQNTRSKGIGTTLLLEVDEFAKGRNIDFILLFADNKTLYLRNGYKTCENKCKWLKIDNESQITNGIGYESMNELMVKEVGKREWTEGDLDLLGYLY
jgi:predicted N-acetyltransferase YhbS